MTNLYIFSSVEVMHGFIKHKFEFISIIRPRSKLEMTRLLIKREITHVNLKVGRIAHVTLKVGQIMHVNLKVGQMIYFNLKVSQILHVNLKIWVKLCMSI